jgi:DoxX-like family
MKASNDSENAVLQPKWQRVVGYVLTFVPGLMLLFSATMKVVGGEDLVKGFTHLGIPLELQYGLASVEALCALIFMIPKTSFLGAILITGYMGGAMLAHLRIGEPFFVQFMLGVIVWVGYSLRNPQVIKKAF